MNAPARLASPRTSNPTPSQTALELTGRSYISWSALATYRTCPLKYFFRYVERLPEPVVSASLAFGAALHQAVEFHFRELLAGMEPPDLDMLLAEFWDGWREREVLGQQIRFGRNEDLNAIGRLAERTLLAFQASDFARPTGTILGVEEELRGAIAPDCPELLARVDLLVEQRDTLVVTDLKTARSRWRQSQVEESSEQLLLYGHLASRLAPQKRLRLEFVVITKTKNPAVETHRVELDTHRMQRTKQVAQRVWRAIQSGHFYPAPSPMACGSCAFREPCRRWRG